MKTRLSGLIDGELEAREAAAVLDAVKGDTELRECWRRYQLIGDALKGGGSLHRDITARVMAAIDDEPVVLAPRRTVPDNGWSRTVLALAASVAGVALVAWVALGPRDDARPAAELAVAPATAQVAAQAPAGDMREYLAAHQAQAGSLQFRGGTENIRTVAAGGGAFAR